MGFVAREVEIRFMRFRGRRVAYAVSGEGPPLVVPAWWVSHLELNWRDGAFRSFWESVGEGHVLVRYDAPGVGMSDRDWQPQERTLETEVALLGAVLDELGLERVMLLGGHRAVAPRSRSPRGSRTASIGCCCTAHMLMVARSRRRRFATRSS